MLKASTHAVALLFLFMCFPLMAQEAKDPASFHMRDISTLSMVDSLEFYDDTNPDTTLKVKGGVAGITASESAFSNWVQGGENALNSIGRVRLYHNKRKGKNYFGHTFNAALGYIYGGEGFRKTEDRLDYYFKYSRYLGNRFYFSTMVNAKTQMLPGYDYPNDSVMISNFLAPGYLLLKVGVDYMPSKNVKIFLAPLSSKMTIVAEQNLANAGFFGVISGTLDAAGETFLSLGKNLRYEFGGYVMLTLKTDITKMWRLESELSMFSNYKNNPLNIDVDWQLESKIRLTKAFSINFESRLIYDHDIKHKMDDEGQVLEGPRVQFKQFLGLGANFVF